MSSDSMNHRHSPRVPLTFTMATLAVAAGLMSGCGPSAARDAEKSADVGMASHQTTEAVDQTNKKAVTPPSTEPTVQHAAPIPAIPEGGSADVDHIVAIALANNPTRGVFEATRAAAAAEVLHARAWSNPELELSGGRARARDSGEQATIYGIDLKQRIELPGKRSSRIDAAEAGRRIAEGEVAVDALALESDVRVACLELATAEAALIQAQAALDIATQMNQTVLGRLAAKETEPGELARAKLELITATAARDQRVRLVAVRQAAIRTWCGGGLPEKVTIQGALPEMPPAIDHGRAFAIAAEHHPRLKLLLAQRDVQIAGLRREERAWYPDLTVGGFSDRESDTNTLGVSLGIEIPLWNRNQGGIAMAQAGRRKAEAELRAEQQFIARTVELAWQTYDSQRLAVSALLGEAQSAADEALKAKLSAYAAGEVSLFDVLEARRAAQAVETSTLDARRTAAEAWLDLGRAVGTYSFSTPDHPVTAPVGDQP